MSAPVPSGAEDSRRAEPDLAEKLVRRFFWLCENPRTRSRMLALIEASVSDRESAQRFYAFLNRRMAGILGRRVTVSASRVELVGAQLIGTAMLRYVLRVEPVASMSLPALRPMVAAAVRAILDSEPFAGDVDIEPREAVPATFPQDSGRSSIRVQMKATDRTR